MSLRRCTVSDLFKATSRVITDEGYLVATGVLARPGVQVYRARELGLDGGDKEVRLYRPPEEVFAAETIASFDGKPITMNHPPTDVVAENWRKYAVGEVRDVKQADGHMTGTLLIKDKAAVDAVLNGKSALSNGYSFDFDPTPGQAPDGSAYDAIQRRQRGNHTAIVATARCGSTCRIKDHETEETPMATRTIVLDGISIELETTQASLVEKIVGDAKKAEKLALDAVTAAAKEVADAKAALKTATDAATKAAADHAVVVADLTAKILKPEQIEMLAAERAKVVADATLLCPDYKAAGKTVPVIRAEVLGEVIAKDEALKPVANAVLGGVEPAKAAEPITRAAFDAVVAARGTRADDGAQARDAAIARAFVGDPLANPAGGPKLHGRDLFMARMKAGFQSEPAAK